MNFIRCCECFGLTRNFHFDFPTDRYTREFESLCMRGGVPDELSGYGMLSEEVYCMREMGRPEAEIRSWLVQKLKELVAR